jgi:5-hydroxyisourate hydrolase
MGILSTHVLDTTSGMPAEGIRIELFRGDSRGEAPLKKVTANADGRTEAPLLEGTELLPGQYLLVFHVGEYFRRRGHPDAGRFLDSVPVTFIVDDAANRYHVPLLVSPWSYTTYRGS